MTRTQGTRKESDGDGYLRLAPGEYGYQVNTEEWMARPPNPQIHMGSLRNHEVIEHADGTITVSPSILITTGVSWHGYLQRGVWREC